MNKKILVTGGSGLIGSYLQQIIPSAEFVSSKDFNLLKNDQVEKMFNKIKQQKEHNRWLGASQRNK